MCSSDLTDELSGAIVWAQDELNALVEEAHRGGVRVAAHVYSDEGARMAVDAGVDSIEHGLYVREETFRAMAAKNIVIWVDAILDAGCTKNQAVRFEARYGMGFHHAVVSMFARLVGIESLDIDDPVNPIGVNHPIECCNRPDDRGHETCHPNEITRRLIHWYSLKLKV